jgi:hypothetical protein
LVWAVALSACSTTIDESAPTTTLARPDAVAVPEALEFVKSQRPDAPFMLSLTKAELVGSELIISTSLEVKNVPAANSICRYADGWWAQSATQVTASRVLAADGSTMIRRRGVDRECGTGDDLSG